MLSTFQAALLPLCAIAGALFPFLPANARPDPADPASPVPVLRYLSPMRSYQGLADTPVAPWRETNDRLWQRGVVAPAAATPAASAPMSSNGGHAGHPVH